MSATDLPDVTLAADFPAADEARWRAEVEKVLAKGKDGLTSDDLAELFEKTLVTRTVDGLRIGPLYTATDPPRPTGEGLPGLPPFVRGGTPAVDRSHGWDVRQLVHVPAGAERNGAAVAEQVREELERGATSVVLDLRALVAGGTAITVDLLDSFLEGVYLDLGAIVIESGAGWRDATSALIELWDRRDVPAQERKGVLGVDPVGRWAEAGGAFDLEDELAGAAEVAARADHAGWSGVRAIAADASLAHEAGGGDVEELGWSIALGVEYLRALTGAGMDVDAAARQIEFIYAATPDQFLTMAKLRAARRLWQRATAVAGAREDGQRQRQHAVTSSAAATRYDTWTNLLRATIECFAAGAGGADAVTVLPHDHLVIPGGSATGRRMARNTQLVLIEESNVSKVADMAGGSWYVEDLTDQLSTAGWAFFREIERHGGAVNALRDGTISNRVNEVRARRDRAIATRRHPLTGLTEFPDIGETPPPAAGEGSPRDDAEGALFTPLAARRYAEPFETQRARADRIESQSGDRPEIFLVTLGPSTMHTARATFAKNLFEVAGIRAITGAGYGDAGAAAAAFRESGARLACICGDDRTYADLAVSVAGALAEERPVRLYLAGRPPGLQDDLEAAGVDELLYAGMDILEVLTRALDALEGTTR